MTHKIIDNILSEELSEKIKNDLISSIFPWYYNTGVVDGEQENYLVCPQLSLYNYQFTHVFYHDYGPQSPYLPNLKCIIDYLNPRAILRIKANLNPRTEVKHTFDYHVDFPGSYNDTKTAIYYVNSNDGVTILEDGTEIESIENRIVIFDQKILHTGTTCTDQKVRCVINFNYIER
jgi:hypothetical protein